MTARDKSKKFVELANKRVSKSIKDLQLVCNLANRQNYDFTDDQARKIVKALQQEVELVKVAFANANESSKKDFKL